MLRPRIIPCLLIHDSGLIKTVKFNDPKYIGDPINAVKIFNEKEADELIVLDIDATVQNREPNFRLISQIAAECRMPLCYGGGVRSVEHVKRIINLGVEKIALSSAVIENPLLISEIASEVGSQSVVVVFDVKNNLFGKREVWTHNGKINTGEPLIDLVKEAERLGAGEILINSIDRDGQMKGYDLVLAREVRKAIRLPLTVLGGAGSFSDINKLINECGIVGASAGSLFVFQGQYRAVLISYPTEEQKFELIKGVF